MTEKLASSVKILRNKAIKSVKRDPFNGAALLTDDGQETPITEAMIQAAINAFENPIALACDVSETDATH